VVDGVRTLTTNRTGAQPLKLVRLFAFDVLPALWCWRRSDITDMILDELPAIPLLHPDMRAAIRRLTVNRPSMRHQCGNDSLEKQIERKNACSISELPGKAIIQNGGFSFLC
jgi:hypothetical protein